MALLLHCDGCRAQDAPCATNEAPSRIKVTQGVIVFGDKFDLCNRCIAKINTVLQRPIDTPPLPPPVLAGWLKNVDPEISGRG